ncbi:MAG TPA: Ig-like domain-containing protein, partial [Spirochaetota bacterium]|nr:Ig-like domain-containing protein [Spirochaetota bacterium]
MFKKFVCLLMLAGLAACSEDAALNPGNLLSAGTSSSSQNLSSGSLSSGATSSQPVLDTEKPVVALKNLADGDTVAVSPLFLWGTVSDDSGSASVYLQLDSGSWQTLVANATNAWSVSLPLSSLGSHSISWYARDAAGNSTSTNSLSFTYDSGAPALTINAPVNGSSSRLETVSMDGTAAAPSGSTLTAVECRVASAAFSSVANLDSLTNWTWGPMAVAEGVHTLTARATAANGKTAEKSVTVTIDRTRPTATISAPSATSAGNVTLTIAAADSLSGIQTVRILRDGVVVKTLGPSIPATTTISMLTQGSYTIGIASTDKAGNASLTNTASITIYAAPVVSISSPTGTGTVVTSPFTISGTASVAGGTITNVFYKFGSGSFAPVDDGGSGYATWSKSVTPGTYGNQTLTVRAYGNMGQFTETNRSFIWDPIRPLAGFVNPLDGFAVTVNEQFTITITNNDVGTGVKTLKLAVNGT